MELPWLIQRSALQAMLPRCKMAQNCQPLTAVCSVKPIVSNFRRWSFTVSFAFLPSLLENSFSSLLAEKISHPHGILTEIYLLIQCGKF